MVGKRSEKKMAGMVAVALPTVNELESWKQHRKRFTYVPGKEVAYRNDPEFGPTPYQRRFGVSSQPDTVKRRNEIMKTCAGLVDEIFEEKEIEVEIPTKYGTTRKIKKVVRVVDGKVANRDAVRAAFALCLDRDGNVSAAELKEQAKKFAEKTYEELVSELRSSAIGKAAT